MPGDWMLNFSQVVVNFIVFLKFPMVHLLTCSFRRVTKLLKCMKRIFQLNFLQICEEL